MKKYLKITVSVAAVVFIATPLPLSTPAFAQDTSVTANTTATDAQSQAIIGRGDLLITQQINSLNRIKARVAADQRLSSSDQATLTSQLDAQIASLTTLKAKLDAETTVATAQADVASLTTNYPLNSFYNQKVGLVRSISAQQAALIGLTTTIATLQGQVTSAQSAARNFTQPQTWLNDATAKVRTAQSQLATAEASILALQPGDYANNQTTVAGYQDQLLPARANYFRAQADVQTVRSSLFWSTLWF